MHRTNIEVSIIIINYNNFDILYNCLSTLFFHTINISFEVIVVDNGSKNFPVDDFCSRFPSVILIANQNNLGFSTANNIGMNAASGEYFLLLNNDMVFIENCIETTLDYVKTINTPALIACELLNADGTHQISFCDFDSLPNTFSEAFFLNKIFPKKQAFNKYFQNYISTQSPIDVDILKGAFLLGKADLFKQLGGFDTRFFFYAEETDLCFNFKKRGGRIVYFPLTKIIHLGGATTTNIPWFSFYNMHISIIKFYQKNYAPAKRFLLILIRYLGIAIRVPIYLVMACLLFNGELIKKSFFFSKLLFIYPKDCFK